MAYLNVPGNGLPIPTNLFPTELYQSTQDWNNGQVTLSAAGQLIIPRGTWLANTGLFSAIQFLDPVQNAWRTFVPPRATKMVASDGYNYRIQNLLGSILGAVITTKGSGYVQAGTTIAASAGNSVWQAIVGGSLAVSTVANAGASYTIPPTVAIPGPPTVGLNGVGGIQATAYSSLSSNTVSGVTLVNVGAGYTQSTITALLLPSPLDPNYISGSITIGSVLFTLTNSGALTGAICTNPGQSVATNISLTVSGAGSSAALSPLIGQCVTATSIVAAGATYGTTAPLITSVGGYNTNTDALKNPALSLDQGNFVPIPFNAIGTLASQSLSAITIIDNGFFISAPTALVIPGTGNNPVAASVASVTFTMGSTIDTVFLQPMGGT